MTQLAIRDKTEAQHRYGLAAARLKEAIGPVMEAVQQMFRQLAEVFTAWAEQMLPWLKRLASHQAARADIRRRMHCAYRTRQLARRRRR